MSHGTPTEALRSMISSWVADEKKRLTMLARLAEVDALVEAALDPFLFDMDTVGEDSYDRFHEALGPFKEAP